MTYRSGFNHENTIDKGSKITFGKVILCCYCLDADI